MLTDQGRKKRSTDPSKVSSEKSDDSFIFQTRSIFRVIRRTGFSAVLKILLVGFLAGWASFMFMPLIVSGLLSDFTASFLGVLISLPLLLYLLDFPSERMELREYLSERHWYGVTVDLLMTFLGGLAPAVVVLYFMLDLRVLPPVPVSSATAVGIFVGYSAFLFRNSEFFREDSSDIVL